MSDGEGSAQLATVETGQVELEQQQNMNITKDDDEPHPKKLKLATSNTGNGGGTDGRPLQLAGSDKLEHRLGGILCCAVCLDLPRSAIYQVTLLFHYTRS